jgi:hypothetical protein
MKVGEQVQRKVSKEEKKHNVRKERTGRITENEHLLTDLFTYILSNLFIRVNISSSKLTNDKIISVEQGGGSKLI